MPGEWPDLGALELLVGVDDLGSLGLASRRAGIAQPNASRAIRNLEKHFGFSLLVRRPTGSTLTPEGTVVVHWARTVLENSLQLTRAVNGLRAESATRLSVSASMTVAEHLLPAWLGELRCERTETGVHLDVQNSAKVAEKVLGGECDIGFVESPTIPRKLREAVVASDRLVVVVAPGHTWTRRRTPITADELAATPLLVREPGSGTRTTLETALSGIGTVHPLLELGSSAAVRTSALEGVGPAVLSTLAVSDQLRSGDLREVAVENLDLRRLLRAVWTGPRRPPGPAGELLKIAVERTPQPDQAL
ncbi:LysR family transcriptional regulator [Dietzia sp. 179-F 9C3 NHS]|uniref:LysR family transcriptional regulator n=1 Tax=Dietzia sp. 179-F 9C3 NHS TaxID=3374295 RepID=UPI00387A3D3E